jgi:hypothetical protein
MTEKVTRHIGITKASQVLSLLSNPILTRLKYVYLGYYHLGFDVDNIALLEQKFICCLFVC